MIAREQKKTSFYLLRRAEALLGAVRFFRNEGASAPQRQLRFLAQSDFWEWEMENLIYSFTSFAERARTWRTAEAANQKLLAIGIVVDAKVVKSARWRGEWRLRQRDERVAPVEMLRQTIDEWNLLIREVEARFVTPMAKIATRYNVQTVRNLGHLLKNMPSFNEE